MRVVSYIPGECLDHVDKCYLTPSLLYSVGHSVGRAEAIIQVDYIYCRVVWLLGIVGTCVELVCWYSNSCDVSW